MNVISCRKSVTFRSSNELEINEPRFELFNQLRRHVTDPDVYWLRSFLCSGNRSMRRLLAEWQTIL